MKEKQKRSPRVVIAFVLTTIMILVTALTFGQSFFRVTPKNAGLTVGGRTPVGTHFLSTV